MATASELLERAAACRDVAKRAKRLAASLLGGPERDRLIAYSVELEEQASGLEKEAEAVAPPVQQEQVQQQQQHEAESKPIDPKDSGHKS